MDSENRTLLGIALNIVTLLMSLIALLFSYQANLISSQANQIAQDEATANLRIQDGEGELSLDACNSVLPRDALLLSVEGVFDVLITNNGGRQTALTDVKSRHLDTPIDENSPILNTLTMEETYLAITFEDSDSTDATSGNRTNAPILLAAGESKIVHIRAVNSDEIVLVESEVTGLSSRLSRADFQKFDLSKSSVELAGGEKNIVLDMFYLTEEWPFQYIFSNGTVVDYAANFMLTTLESELSFDEGRIGICPGMDAH